MSIATYKQVTRTFPWALFAVGFFAPFAFFLKAASHEWFTNPMFSYGALMPVISGYLIWTRRAELSSAPLNPYNPGLLLLLCGSGLLLMGTLSGLLLVSGVAVCVSLVGAVAFIWSARHAKIVALPLTLLVFMAPWPTFVMGDLSWRLQEIASTASADVLSDFGTAVYQDGNLLVLPRYVMEVKEACSGTRSLFALVSMASVLAILMRRRWIWRLLLIAAAPLIALLANIIRIVGTGIAVEHFGSLAAQESVHTVWGLVIFALAFGALLTTRKLLKWASYKFESA